MLLKANCGPARRRVLLVPMLLLGLAMTPLAQAQMAHPMPSAASMPMPAGHQAAKAPDGMKHSMMGGMAAMQDMPMSGDTDKDFAMMMKIHHQGAVDMAQLELANGKSPAMKAMARRIIAAQKQEIAQFDRWLAGRK